jgi:phosphatidylserine/phosphatidylglycerophosphate/cardiolipin synthase-like enzyme
MPNSHRRAGEHSAPSPDRLVVAVADRRPALLDVIRRAQREVTLSLFRCNDDEIFAELGAAVKRGVAVDVLVTSRAKGGKKKREQLWNALEKTGASVHAYTDPVVKYHAKYLVVDDGPAVVASLNFTRKCFRKTWDALVITHDADVVTGLRRLMACDRDGKPAPADLTPRLIIGPERARRQLTSLIEEARSSIRLVDAKLSDPDLIALLRERRAAGIAVNVYGAKKLGDLKSHGKIMLIDDRIAVVGSLALAALSLDFRREVAIVVDEPSAIADAKQLFADIDDAQEEFGIQNSEFRMRARVPNSEF